MLCTTCKTELLDGTDICPICGTILDASATQPIPTLTAQQSQPMYNPTAQQSQPTYNPTVQQTQSMYNPTAGYTPIQSQQNTPYTYNNTTSYQPLPYTYSGGYSTPYATQQQSIKKLRRIVGITVIVILVIAAIFFVASSILKNNPESVAETYCEKVLELDLNSIDKYWAVDFEALIEEVDDGNSLYKQYDVSSYEKVFDLLHLTMQEGLKEEFGEDYTITAQATNEKTLSESEKEKVINDVRNQFIEVCGSENISHIIKFSDIEEICQVNITYKIRGSLSNTTDQVSVYCAKMNGKWKVLSDSDDLFSI